MNDPPLLSVELREVIGHARWLELLLGATFLVPFISLIPIFGASEVFVHLIVAFVALPLVLFIVNLWRARAAWFVRVTESGKEEPLSEIDWQTVATARQVPVLLCRGLLRLEFLGWIVFVTAVSAALAIALEKIPAGSILTGYFRILNVASADLTRAAVIGVIVLFFTQIFKHFQAAIDKADRAAKMAEAAMREGRDDLAKAREGLVKATGEIPKLSETSERTLGILESGHALLGTETISYRIAQALRKASESLNQLNQVRDLSTMLEEHVRRIGEEVVFSANIVKDDPVDLVALSGLYRTYLMMEALNFEGDETGRRGCRLSTRFAHYALAVRNIVEELEGCERGRYHYYTMLNRTPEQFFNVENFTADMSWSVGFLEEFCRSHADPRKPVPYTRYFLACRGDIPYERREPPKYYDVQMQLSESKILCVEETGRPILWGPLEKEELKRENKNDLAETLLPQKVVDELSRLEIVQTWVHPSYIIRNAEGAEALEKEVAQKGIGGLILTPLKDVLVQYHWSPQSPRILCFASLSEYDNTFEHSPNGAFPRDLFGIWDKKEERWRLFVGTMLGHGDPMAVTLIYATPTRAIKNLSWESLDKLMTQIFRLKGQSLSNTTLRNLNLVIQ